MKKLILFRDGYFPDSGEVDRLIHTSELSKDTWIDHVPEEVVLHTLEPGTVFDSTWQIVFKGDEEYDNWHIVIETMTPIDFSDIHCKRAHTLLAPYKGHASLRTVLNEAHRQVLIYRLPKVLSELLQEHLTLLIPSFTGDRYVYEIPEEDLSAVINTLPPLDIT